VPDFGRDVRRFTRPAFDELARSLHASYLSRWSRHHVTGLERNPSEAVREPDKETEGQTTAA
jgi:hypothetical protein